MPTYVVYERHTGQIAHTHIDPEGVLSTPEDILLLVDQDRDKAGLVVTLADEPMVPEPTGQRVDPFASRIIPVAEGAIGAAGGGRAIPFHPERETPTMTARISLPSRERPHVRPVPKQAS
jgi:hypothetical protein